VSWAHNTGTFALEFSLGFLFALDAFKRRQLRFREEATVLRHLGFERLQALFHGGQVVTNPNARDAARRDRQALFGELVRNPMLSPRGLPDSPARRSPPRVRSRCDCEGGIAAADLAKRLFATVSYSSLNR
jgi:hypothetical protein